MRVDSKSVWLFCGPQGSPAPRWEAAVDLAGATEKVWMWEALAETVLVALCEVVWGYLYDGGASSGGMIGGW